MNNALKRPGGNLSKQSQLVSTSRPIRSGCSVTRICETAPPESLPTIVTSSSSSRARNSLIIRATPGGLTSAASETGSECEPIGQSGTMQRWVEESSAALSSQRRQLAPKPWTKTIGSPEPASR